MQYFQGKKDQVRDHLTDALVVGAVVSPLRQGDSFIPRRLPRWREWRAPRAAPIHRRASGSQGRPPSNFTIAASSASRSRCRSGMEGQRRERARQGAEVVLLHVCHDGPLALAFVALAP
eukprot:scaffold3514_cov132-Isochrysis_galbana.AAC.3